MFNVIFDSYNYKSKPTRDEYKDINERLSDAESETIGILKFKERILEGRCYVSGHLEDKALGIKKGNIENINFFSLDIDNNYKENGKDIYTNYTEKQVIDTIETITGATPFIVYDTFTGMNEANNSKRFRLLYALSDAVDGEGIQLLLKYILDNSPSDMLDANCINSNRIFQGTNKTAQEYPKYRELDVRIILELKAKESERQLEQQSRREARKRLQSEYSLDQSAILDELKQIDLSDYLIRRGYQNIKSTGKGYKMPCPIHKGQKDNFSINYENGVWLWKCFSGCDGLGGTILDLHCELEGVSLHQAIEDLKSIYGISNMRASESLERNADTYTIDKYISGDTGAKKGILDAINDHKSILITGSMGIGKTHFVSNDLLAYSKASGKPIVMVIPGVKQLEYLYESKDIPVVYEKLPEYLGTDIVATTPESLPKITAQLGIEGYILVIDESHERYLSLYRRGYKNKNIDSAIDTAYRTIHLSATPRILAYDSFDRIINIETRCRIENKVSILKMKGNKDDVIVSLLKRSTRKGRQVILFNNNKRDNELYLSEALKDTTLEGETVSSETNSSDISKGTVSKDLTITTSVITAGIDLETRDNALLLIDLESINVDNMIQLIGRFRKGLEVVILIKDRTEREYTALESIVNYKLKASVDVIEFMNSKPGVTELLVDGFKEDSGIIYDNNTWKPDKIGLVSKSYKAWNEIIQTRPGTLIDIFTKQNAFKISGEIKIYNYSDQEEKSVSEKKKLDRQEAKREKDNIIPQLLKLRADSLTEALMKKDASECFDQEVKELADVIDRYKEIAPRELDTIKELSKTLFFDAHDNTYYHSGLGFKFYHSNTKKRVNHILDSYKASEINQLIKEHGLEFYLSKELKQFRSSKDILQAKIRAELQSLEAVQGRISDTKLTELTETLIKEGYLWGKSVKTYKAEDTDTEDREKAFSSIKQSVWYKIECIYNLKRKNEISSVKASPEAIRESIGKELLDNERQLTPGQNLKAS